MAPKLCGSKPKKILRKRASCEIKHDDKDFEECKRSRLIATDEEKKDTKRLEKLETQKPSIAEEKQISDESNNPEVVSLQNPDNEVNDNSIKVESKIIPSFGKNSGPRITTTKAKDQKEFSPTRKSQLKEKVIGTEENTVKCDSDESGYPREEFEDIVKSFVCDILDLASKETSASCEVALSMIRKETSILLKDSRHATGAEISSKSSVDPCRETQTKVNAETSNVTAEQSLKKSERNLCQSGKHGDESELMLNKSEVKRALGESIDPKTDEVTTESKNDLRKTRKKDSDSNGGGCVVRVDDNIRPEEQDISCASSTFTAMSIVQDVPPKAAIGGKSVLQQSEQDGHQQDNDVPAEQRMASFVETDLVTCKRSDEEKETTEEYIDKIQQNMSGSSKGGDELPEQEDIDSGDAKSLSASDKPTTSSSLRAFQEKSDEGSLPSCVDLDFTSSQLLQIEEVETKLIQQEENGPSSKLEGTSQSIQRVQDEDTDSIASRRRDEERRDDRRVKEIMQKMMKDLNEIKLVTDSLLGQMTQYRKHRSQRQPQPSRLTGTHATTSGFYRGKLGKGSGSSQFKKS